jgi:hypothetical protein
MRTRLARVAFVAVVALFPARAATQTVEWISDSSGDWMTGSNWSTGQPPDGVDVIIDRGEANPVVSLVSDASVYLRSIHASESLTISLSGWRAELLLVEPSSFHGAIEWLCCTLFTLSTVDISAPLTA